MKKKFTTCMIVATLWAGAAFIGCESSEKKMEAAEKRMQDAEQNLQIAQNDANLEAQRIANAEKWAALKSESEIIIQIQEDRIAELKEKMKGSKKTFDALYAERVDSLEQRNRDLKIRMERYEQNKSDWESFQREFKHDMDEFGNALKDFTVDNKK